MRMPVLVCVVLGAAVPVCGPANEGASKTAEVEAPASEAAQVEAPSPAKVEDAELEPRPPATVEEPSSEAPAEELAGLEDAVEGFAALLPPRHFELGVPQLETFREGDHPGVNFGARVGLARAGWKADSSEFAACFEVEGCLGCTFRKPGGEEEMLSHIAGDCDEDESKLVAKRLAAGGYDAHGQWAHPSWVFIDVGVHEPDDHEERAFEVVVGHEFGDRRGQVVRFDAYGAFPIAEELLLSPDGETLALVMHDYFGLEGDVPAFDYHIEFIPAKLLLRRAYEVMGFEALGEQEWTKAFESFARAAVVEPTAWKPPFNMACAAARAEQPDRAKIALSEAVRRGGDQARASARKDKDLASVRSLPWFAEVIGK